MTIVSSRVVTPATTTIALIATTLVAWFARSMAAGAETRHQHAEAIKAAHTWAELYRRREAEQALEPYASIGWLPQNAPVEVGESVR